MSQTHKNTLLSINGRKSLIARYLFALIILSSCSYIEVARGTHPISLAVARYQHNAHLVDLGDTKEKFIDLIYSRQNLHHSVFRPPVKYYSEGKKVEIYFVRSRFISFDPVTSEDLTPYLFYDEVLVAIGWPSMEQTEN